MDNGLEWIFFDVGYTLLDESGAWADQFQRLSACLKLMGKDVSPAEINACYQKCCVNFSMRQWKSIVREFAPTPEDAKTLQKLSDDWRFDLETLFPGVKPLLAELSQHWKLGIIANQAKGTRERMEKHGLLEYLTLVVGSAEAGVLKPDPRIFELALSQAQCDARAAMMVGDRLDNDVRSAKALGMKTVHIRQGGSGLQLPRDESEIPSATLERISDLTPMFVRSLG